jgi:hypothetical protein
MPASPTRLAGRRATVPAWRGSEARPDHSRAAPYGTSEPTAAIRKCGAENRVFSARGLGLGIHLGDVIDHVRQHGSDMLILDGIEDLPAPAVRL